MLKQKLLAASSVRPGLGHLYSFGPNFAGGTAQNTATGNTLSPTAAVDTHANWLQISVNGGATNKPVVVGILSDNSLWSWGSNSSGSTVPTGSIGQGNNDNAYYVPTRVGTSGNWTYVTTTATGGLGVKSDGSLYSWGVDVSGELGQGGSSTIKYVPTRVGTDSDWLKVYGGIGVNRRSFLIKRNGTLWALGNNSNYSTGLGTNTGNTLTPTLVGSLSDSWLTVCIGNQISLGIKSDGSLWCWGTDFDGNSFQGSSGGVYTVPTQCGTDTDWAHVTTIQGGKGCTFAVKSSGTLWTAGSNYLYMTGLGTNVGTTLTPTQVGSATNWASTFPLLSQGGYEAFIGLRSDGSLWSWGSDDTGQTGQGTLTGSYTTPTRIGTDNNWVALPNPSATGKMTIVIRRP